MAITVEGATIKATASNGIPMVKGSENLIKINITNPINMNLDTFKNNLQPYLTGDNNVVEIDITGGGDAYVEDIDLNKNKLIIKGKSVYGQTVKEIDLPCAIDGELESCKYIASDNKIRTSWSKVKGDGDEPWAGIIWSQDYTVVTDNNGNIISISR